MGKDKFVRVPTDDECSKAVRAWFSDTDCPPVSQDFINRMRAALLAAAPPESAQTEGETHQELINAKIYRKGIHFLCQCPQCGAGKEGA